MTTHTIIHGDSINKLDEIEENSIACVITSPPYFDAKDYNKEDNNIGKSQEYTEYLNQIEKILIKLNRVLLDGGYVCWNTSPILKEGKRIGIPFDTHILFIKNGYEFLEDIIHVKPDGAAKLRNGGWHQNNGRPTTYHCNIVTEYIMVYKKPGEREQKPYDKIGRYYTDIPKDILTNVWYMNTESSKQEHDAPFCKELAKRCITLFSFPGDIILDPFSGTMTTNEVARNLGRNSIGIELSKKYIEYGKKCMGWGQQNLFEKIEYIEK